MSGCGCGPGKTIVPVVRVEQPRPVNLAAQRFGAHFVPCCCSSGSSSSSSSSSSAFAVSCKVLKTVGPPVCCDVTLPETLILRRDVQTAWSDNYGAGFNGYTTLTYNVASGHWQGSASLTATNQCDIFQPVANCTRTIKYNVRCKPGACTPVIAAQVTAPSGCCGSALVGAYWSSEIINCPTGPNGWTVVRFADGYPWVDPSGSPGGNPIVVHTISVPTA